MLEPRKKPNLTNLCRTTQEVGSLPLLPQGSTQSGFTIVEALVAMMIAATLLISLTPIVVLSVATRVQARRVDLATQAARSYIDGLRANAIPPPGNNDARFRDTSNNDNLGVPAPPRLPPGAAGYDNFGIFCVDKNLNTLNTCGNPRNPPFLVLQAFRHPESDATAAIADKDARNRAIQTEGYCVGVRVYRADAFANSKAPTGTQPLKNMFTETSDTKNHPLVVMRAEILNQTSFEDYSKRFPEVDPDNPRQGSPCGKPRSS